MAGVSDTNYAELWDITDVCDSASVVKADSALMQVGVNQSALYTIISTIITNFNAILAKLDADGGVNLTNYVSGCAMSGIGNDGYKLFANGIRQDRLYTVLAAMETQFELLTAKLDGDTGVEDDDYAETLNFDLDTTLISAEGIKSQGVIVDYLNTVITAINALNAKLDADESA